MKNKIISLSLLFIFIISSLSTVSFSNIQIQVEDVNIDEVFYVEGENVVTHKSIITPIMTVSWDNPDSWSHSPEGSTYDDPEYYDIIVDNITMGTKDTIKINEGSSEFNTQTVDIHEDLKIDTGCLYKIAVQPNHYHPIDEGTGYELAPTSGVPESAYAITDLNTEFVTTDDTIKVIWDDLGSEDFTYRIVYAIGDYTNKSKQELIDNKEGEITGLTLNSDGITKFYDNEDRRYKLMYTIEENVYPGQVYSIMVEPTTDYYNGEPLMRNRNYPVIRSCSTNVELNIYEEGDYLRLEWDVPGSFKVGQDKEEYGLVEATIVEFNDGQESNVVIFDKDAAIIGYYKIPKPNEGAEYQIKFVYSAVANQSKPDIKPISNIAVYTPSDLMITPTKPVVPNMLSKAILDDLINKYPNIEDLRTELANKYLVKGDNYLANIDDLLSDNNTFHIIEDTKQINFVWGAFKRIDVNENSDTYNEYIYDNNIYYDIWVTESLDALSYATRIIEDKRYTSIDTNNIIKKDNNTIGYSQKLSYYYDKESGELKPIVPNKLYYIKLVAKKKNSTGELISEPTIVTLYYGYNGDIYEPPTISKPPLEEKEKDTTKDGISITWGESWWEVISPDAVAGEPLSNWETELWVSQDKTVYNKKAANCEYFAIYKDETEVNRLIEFLGDSIKIQRRKIDLGEDPYGVSDVEYKFLKIPYEEVQKTIDNKKNYDINYSFSDYYYDLIEADKNGTSVLKWVDIETSVDPDNSKKLLYREEGLLPNTSYLFLLYPYRKTFNGQVLYSHFPTPIIVCTEAEDTGVNPNPTVPNLYVSNYTDMSISVTWKYNEDFEYELVYSLIEDINTAERVDWSRPTDVLDPNYPVNGKYYEVKVNDLFPNTEYYFWIRAKQPENNTMSQWSNVVLGKTRDVSNPNPPRGVGIASKESMLSHNYNESITDEFVAIEWILDENDVDNKADAKVKKNYSYIVEVADNAMFIDPIYIVSAGGEGDSSPNNVEILEKNLVKINELIPNRAYYIRVKTRVTVKGSEEGQLIEKDSLSYSTTIKIITVKSGNEYDGDIDPDFEVLPGEDYEITYDKDTKTLEFRFRDNSVDKYGNNDNNVDQRLINKLINDNIYTYEIDVSSYDDKIIKTRKIEIPYSIIEAFNEYKIGLSIDGGSIKIILPQNALSSEVKRQVTQYGAASSVYIQIDELESSYIKAQELGENIDHLINVNNIKVLVKNSKTYEELDYTDKPMEIELKTYYENSVIYSTNHKNEWQEEDSEFDESSKFMTFQTPNLGTYASGLLKTTSQNISSDQGHWSESYRKEILSSYNISGLDNYNPESIVKELEIINIIYNVVSGEQKIDLDGYISSNTINTLVSSGIKENVSRNSSFVKREEAISMFVNAYEIINNKIIKPSSTALQQANSNTQISSSYKNEIAKAYTIGIISDIKNVRPKDSIKFSELFAIWAKSQLN